MAIDRKVEVGRILVRQSILSGGFFRVGGRINRISHARVYYDHPDPQDGRTYWVNKHSVMAVCDTQEEVDKMLAFEREVHERRILLAKEQRADCKRRFGL